MNKHLIYLFLSALFLLGVGCSVADSGIDSDSVSPAEVVAVVEPTASPFPTQVPTEPTVLPPTPEPTAPPIATIAPKPHFKNLRFTGVDGQTAVSFPGGVPEIFAVWEYQQLQSSDVIKRIWTRNGAEWLVREENWEFATYGATGTIGDVSVYDYENGLEPGSYTLTLLVNGSVQVEAAFVIEERPITGTITLSAASSSGVAALVLDGKKLVLEEANGQRTQIATGLEISEIAWFPNGQQFFYVERDDSERIGGSTLGVKHALWHVDVPTGQLTQIGSFDENYHTLAVSPNGRFVRLISGTNFADACGIDRRLFILEVNEQALPVARYDLTTFVSIPEGSFIYPFAQTDGEWIEEERLYVEVEVLCLFPEAATPEELFVPGVYLFELDTLTAVRLSDL